MATEGVSVEKKLPGDLEEIIMDWYLEEGESYEDAEIYARHAVNQMKFSSESYEDELDSILAQMYEIEDMENPTEEDWIQYDNLETRYMELSGVFGAEGEEDLMSDDKVKEIITVVLEEDNPPHLHSVYRKYPLEEVQIAMYLSSTKPHLMEWVMEQSESFEAPYVGSGALMDIGKDTALSSFSPSELATSSAIHGDFDTASLDYSGHQNLEVRAEGWPQRPEPPTPDADGEVTFTARQFVDTLHHVDERLYEQALDDIAWKGYSRGGTWDSDEEGNMILLPDEDEFESHHGHHSETSHSPSATTPAWIATVSSILGFAIGFFGIKELKKEV